MGETYPHTYLKEVRSPGAADIPSRVKRSHWLNVHCKHAVVCFMKAWSHKICGVFHCKLSSYIRKHVSFLLILDSANPDSFRGN